MIHRHRYLIETDDSTDFVELHCIHCPLGPDLVSAIVRSWDWVIGLDEILDACQAHDKEAHA